MFTATEPKPITNVKDLEVNKPYMMLSLSEKSEQRVMVTKINPATIDYTILNGPHAHEQESILASYAMRNKLFTPAEG